MTMELGEKTEIAGNVYTRVHHIDDLRTTASDWEALSSAEKLQRTRSVTPIQEETVSNTTVDGLHEFIVDSLDKDQTNDTNASHLAVGKDDTVAPSVSDSSLTNQIGRTGVTTTTDGGSSLTTSTFIDTSQFNGETINEVGLFTAESGGKMLNHALVTEVQKTDLKTVTFDIKLSFGAEDDDGAILKSGTLGTKTGGTTTETYSVVGVDDIQQQRISSVVVYVTADPSWDADYAFDFSWDQVWDDNVDSLDVDVTVNWTTDPGSGNDLSLGYEVRG